MRSHLNYSECLELFTGQFNQSANNAFRKLFVNKTKVKRLIISGEQGVGKSKIVSSWVKRLEGKRVGNGRDRAPAPV